MADVTDRATEQEEQMRAAHVSYRKPVGPEPTGICLFCGEVVSPERRWCDSDCRDAWQVRLRRAGVREGRV